MQYTTRRRPGFTLPELMVAAAMSMVIMLIIAFAFREGIASFRKLRGVGQMQDRLRSAQNVLKRDLSAEHFGGLFQQGINGPYVRDQRLDIIGWKPPEEGYFEVRQLNPSQIEAKDGDDIPSYFATDHSLRFTVKLTGKRQQDWFYKTGSIAGGDPDFNLVDPVSQTIRASATRWAEVAYYLMRAPDNDTANGTPLYVLCRYELPLFADSQKSIADGRFSIPSFNTVYNGSGDDILLTDVLSFEVKAAWMNNADWATLPLRFGNISPEVPLPSANPDWPVADLPVSQGGRFDTGTHSVPQSYDWNNPSSFNTIVAGAPRFRVRMSTVQIRIRVWDKATQSARQITIVQDV